MHFAGLDRLGLLGITSFGAVNTAVTATNISNITQAVQTTGQATVGSCTPDQQFIYDKTSDGTLYTRRLKVGEVCSSTSGTNPTVNVHNADGSISVTYPDGSTATIPPVVSLTPSNRTMDAEALKRNTDQLQVEALNLKALIALGGLEPCPPESYHDALYDQNFHQYGQDGYTPGVYACFYFASGNRLMPPLTFRDDFSGVAFHLGELVKDKGFSRDFQPNDDQQFWIANALRKITHAKFNDAYGSYIALATTNAGRAANIPQRLYDPSVGDILSWLPDMQISFPGLKWNPPTPSASQMNNGGGMKDWLSKGGFFMSYALASGQEQWGDSFGLGVNATPPCACQTNYVETPAVIAEKMDTTINGITVAAQFGWIQPDGTLDVAGKGKDDGFWGRYIDIVSSPNVWHVEVRHQDPSWIERVAQALGNILEAIGKIFCGDPQVQQGINQLAQTKCIDGNNKPCTKGKAGCTCTTAPASVQAGVALTGWYVSTWCNAFSNEIATNQNPAQLQPVIPPATISTTVVPKWVIALGVIVGAGVLFGLKKRTDTHGKPISLLPPPGA